MSVNIFARWTSEADCLAEMLGLHDEASAQAIVASISQRIADNTLFKSMEGELHIISKADDPEIVVVGPCSWEKVDPEDDLITAKAMSSFFHKWFNVVPERYQNITLNHKSFQAGIPLLKYQGSDGEMYYTHVHEKGAILVSKVRDADGLVQTKDLRQKILNGTYKSYSIYGVPTDIEKVVIDDREVDRINDIDPGDVTYCRAGMNDMANFSVVKTAPDGSLEKPFAGYDDFADCVSQNSDKDDPDAYCATIMEQAEKAEILITMVAAAIKEMTLEEINTKITGLRDKVEANRKRIDEYYESIPDTPDWVNTLYEENNALYDELSAWREARVERIVADATAPAAEKTKDIDVILEESFDEAMETLEAQVRTRIKPSEGKPKSREERSKAMDERTLETALKVREIFKELEKIE